MKHLQSSPPARRRVRLLVAVLTVALGVPAVAQETPPKPASESTAEDERSPLQKELDKLYEIDVELRGAPLTFERLAELLVRATGAPRKGRSSRQNPEYEIEYETHERDGLVMRLAGRVGIAYGRSYKAPRPGDAKECEKKLNVGGRFSALGAPLRSIHFELRITATDKLDGRRKVIRYGSESIDFRIVEDPQSKALHLIVDESSYLKHRERVESNAVESSGDSIEDELEAFRKKLEDEKESASKGADPLAITRVEDFKLQGSSIVIEFRRRWARDKGAPVRGTLNVKLDRSLSSVLYYAPIPDDPDARTVQVKVAYFTGGRPKHLKR